MVSSEVAHRRQAMLTSKFEAKAKAEREAQQREAALAAAASRAALVAESLAQASRACDWGTRGPHSHSLIRALTFVSYFQDRPADPNFPVVDSAATPRSEASDSDMEGGTPGRAGSTAGTPSRAGSAAGTPSRAGSVGAGTPGRVGSSGRRPSSGTPGSSRSGRVASGSPRGGAAGGRGRSRKAAGSPTVLEVEEGEGEVEDDGGDDEAGATPSRPGTGMSGAKSPASHGGSKRNLMGRLGGGGRAFLSRKRASKPQAGGDEIVEAGSAHQPAVLTAQELQDAAFWVQQAQKLEAAAAPDGPAVKTLEKQKKALKKDQVQASKAIKELEKSMSAPPKKDKDAKKPAAPLREVIERMAALELEEAECQRRVEDAEARIARCGATLASVAKLREWVQGQVCESGGVGCWGWCVRVGALGAGVGVCVGACVRACVRVGGRDCVGVKGRLRA